MPALTLAALAKSLSTYVRTDGDFVDTLNMVLPRLYAMGNWKDLIFDYSISTAYPYFSLPEHAEGVLAAMVELSPATTRVQWHDYRLAGYDPDGPSSMFGVVDDGLHPTKVDLATDVEYSVTVNPESPNTTLPDEGSVFVTYVRADDTIVEHEFVLDGSAAMTSPNPDIVDVVEIRLEDVYETVSVKALDQPDELDPLELAVARGNEVVRYRRHRIENPTGRTMLVQLLLKRKFRPLLLESDVEYLGNLNVLKHAILGSIAEDNADLERANYHWSVCQSLLDEELDAFRGAARPSLRLDPTGTGSMIPNVM